MSAIKTYTYYQIFKFPPGNFTFLGDQKGSPPFSNDYFFPLVGYRRDNIF